MPDDIARFNLLPARLVKAYIRGKLRGQPEETLPKPVTFAQYRRTAESEYNRSYVEPPYTSVTYHWEQTKSERNRTIKNDTTKDDIHHKTHLQDRHPKIPTRRRPIDAHLNSHSRLCPLEYHTRSKIFVVMLTCFDC